MKFQTSSTIALLIAAYSVATAATASGTVNAADFEDTARVVSVSPQYEQVNYPQQRCTTEYGSIQRDGQRSMGGSIVGGIAGGFLGSQIGGGSGRTAAAAAGAIAGAIAGDRIENSNQGGYVEQRPVQRCQTVDNWQTRASGYAVTYEYNGPTHTSMLPYDPGPRLRLQVSITPHL
jgi:uncharacterized protein YcfJ